MSSRFGVQGLPFLERRRGLRAGDSGQLGKVSPLRQSGGYVPEAWVKK